MGTRPKTADKDGKDESHQDTLLCCDFNLCCRVGLVSVKCTVKHTITGQWLTACACHVSIIVLPCV